MEDINLHFTGDIHAIGAANNLLAAMIDNHIMHGNALDIDINRITWRRCVDMNDRQLRYIRDGLGGEKNGVERSDGFDITVATETMAVFCLADSLADLKARLARMIVGYTYDGAPVTAAQLNAVGAMAALLKDAILSGRDLRADETLQKHADWAEALQGRYTFTPENTEQILQQEVGAVFMQVLEDAGVYKRTPAGQSAFLRFIASV